MARKIIENVRAKEVEIKADPDEAEANAQRAIVAILGGRNSAAYRTYMLQFVEKDAAGNPTEPLGAAQLARLLSDDEPIPGQDMKRRRAYMLANAVCGGGSPTNGGRFDFEVETVDTGLELGAEAGADVNRAAEAGTDAAPDAGAASG